MFKILLTELTEKFQEPLKKSLMALSVKTIVNTWLNKSLTVLKTENEI